MLTSLEIENFKGIAARQRIDFAPVTLLFGANSAGKSSILQALVYLHELLVRGNADVAETQLGGSVLELGGFARLVHRHDARRAIVLRADFRTPATLNWAERDLDRHWTSELDDEIDDAWCEVVVEERSTTHHIGPLVTKALIGVGGSRDPLLYLTIGNTLREGEPISVHLNIDHPLLAARDLDIDARWGLVADGFADILDEGEDEARARRLMIFAISRAWMSALPPLDRPFRLIVPDKDPGDFGAPHQDAAEREAIADEVRAFLELIILGATNQLALTLERALYVGPLRAVPPRGFLFERAGRATRWSDGLAAWDLLLSDRGDLVDRTNAWLAKLGAGCRIVMQELINKEATAEDLSTAHVDSLVRRLLLDTGAGALVLPSEVGAGIAQLVPIVVAAILAGRVPLVMIEQPEIHVHPALQVGLGDLFLEAASRHNRQLLVETHSEHLLLRLMRRMRETAEGKLRPEVPPTHQSDVKVWFVEREPMGCMFRQMLLNERGDLVKAWPGGFFEEGLREVME